MKEGINNNPGVADLKTTLAFDLYEEKALDFKTAEKWLQLTCQDKSANYADFRLLAHAYDRAGQLDDCEKKWKDLAATATAQYNKNPTDSGLGLHMEVCQKNLDGFLARRALRANLSQHQTNIHFDCQFRKLSPRVFQLSGNVDLPKGARVRVELCDEDYKFHEISSFNWNIDNKSTVLIENGVHGMYVDHNKFSRKYDLSADLKAYPFKKDRYILRVSVDPRDHTADAVLNILGWNGEGLADQPYLDKSVAGERRISKTFHLQRKDLI
jgi:hypothetical protein